MPYKVIVDDKIKQQKLFAKAISDSSCVIALNISGSNDLKFMIVQEVNEKHGVVPLVKDAAKKWEALSEHQKIVYNPKRVGLFPKDSEMFIKSKVKQYMDIVIAKYKDSSFKIVYHSSILERVYFSKLRNAEIYIGIINFYISSYIKDLNKKQIRNRDGIPIKFGFINVASQFYEEKTKDKTGLFKDADVKHKRYVHRNIKAWKKLMTLYLKAISTE